MASTARTGELHGETAQLVAWRDGPTDCAWRDGPTVPTILSRIVLTLEARIQVDLLRECVGIALLLQFPRSRLAAALQSGAFSVVTSSVLG